MGANIGTSVTSTIVSLAHIRNVDQLERAFTAGTVHDMFNFMTVAILFPLEIATGYLKTVTGALVDGAETNQKKDPWEGPVKKYVSPVSKKVIISNKKLIQGIANGRECSDYYPIQCDEGLAPSYDTCTTGLTSCISLLCIPQTLIMTSHTDSFPIIRTSLLLETTGTTDAPLSFASRHHRGKIKSPELFASSWQLSFCSSVS
jgi:hypothetical protein